MDFRTAHRVATIIVIAAAVNWLFVGLFGYNFAAQVFGARSMSLRIVHLIVGLSAVAIMFHRDTYLPFLGETVLPCSALPEQIPNGADTTVQIKTAPNAKILYWAAEPATEGMKGLQDWRKAYMKFLNVGVVTSNEKGIASLYVRNPQPYTVPWSMRIEPHVHFRTCGDSGMMGPVKTVFVSSGEIQ